MPDVILFFATCFESLRKVAICASSGGHIKATLALRRPFRALRRDVDVHGALQERC